MQSLSHSRSLGAYHSFYPTRASLVDLRSRKAAGRFADVKVLTMPGLHGSEAGHWQSAWERSHPAFERVQQKDWEHPVLDDWARQLVERAIGHPEPIVVVAHSFGCLATVRASWFQSGLIAGALLVAPAEPQRFEVEAQIPQSTIDFPTTLVASTDDPYMSHDSARAWAERWGSELVTLNSAGHINVQAGFSEWTLGLELLERLCLRVAPVARGAVKVGSLG